MHIVFAQCDIFANVTSVMFTRSDTRSFETLFDDDTFE